jgi:hypothetical protein
MADSLKVYDILKDAQIPDSQARAITQAIRESDAAVALDIRAVLTERFDFIDKRFDLLERRIDGLTTWANERFATKADLAEVKAELMRWMFFFWVGQTASTAGIVFAVFKLWR